MKRDSSHPRADQFAGVKRTEKNRPAPFGMTVGRGVDTTGGQDPGRSRDKLYRAPARSKADPSTSLGMTEKAKMHGSRHKPSGPPQTGGKPGATRTEERAGSRKEPGQVVSCPYATGWAVETSSGMSMRMTVPASGRL